MIAAPLIRKNTWNALEATPSRTLRLLANLWKVKKLNDVDAVWKERMGKWVGTRLAAANWQRTEQNARGVFSKSRTCADFIDRSGNCTIF